MKKVLIIGSGGAGKSTLARQLGEATGLPVIHLDAHYWHSGWVPTENAEWDRQIEEFLARPAWIMDGNYGRTLPRRLAACDTVIFLDFPRLVCLWNLVKRRVQFARRPRTDLPEGCPEHLSLEFLWWVLTYPSRRRPGILAQLARLPEGTRVHTLRNSRDVRAFIEGSG